MKRLLSIVFLLSALVCGCAKAQSIGDFQIPQKVNATGPFSPKNFGGGNSKLWGTNGSGAPVSLTLGAGLGNDGTNLTLDADLVTWAGVTSSANGRSLVSAADYAAMRALLDLEVGTDVQGYSANLGIYAGIAPSANVQSLLGAANYAAIKGLLNLGDVENTALSTWAGSANITTVGTIGAPTFTDRITINKAGQSEAAGLEVVNDPANGDVRALRILSPANSTRVYFGGPGQAVYAVNFSNVSNLEGVPAFETSSGLAVGGMTNTFITRSVEGGTAIGANHPGDVGLDIYQANVWDNANMAHLALNVHRTNGVTYRGASTSRTAFEGVNLGVSGDVYHLWTLAGPDGGTARDLALGVDETEVMRLTSDGVRIERSSPTLSAPHLKLVGFGNNLTIYDDDGTTVRAYLAGGRWIVNEDYTNIAGTFSIGSTSGTAVNLAMDQRVAWSSSSVWYGTQDTTIGREAAAVLQMGLDGAVPVDQTMKGADGAGSNISGGDFTIAAGRGTGSAAGGAVIIQAAESGASGTTPGTLVTRMRVDDYGVSIGVDGAPIRAILYAKVVDDEIGPLEPQTHDGIIITVTGAEVGDSVVLAPSVELVGGTMMFFGWVSEADTVSIRAANFGTTDQGGFTGDFGVTVIKH